MGYIEDTRKLMQDFLAPELRAISARLDALEALVAQNERRSEKRIADFDAHVDQRFSDAEKLAHERFSEIERRFTDVDRRLADIERRAEQRHSETLNAIATLSNYQNVLERLARLETKQNASAA